MAYPRYISKGAFQSGTGALTVPALTGTQAGDIIILFAESANQTINTPTGYSVLATQTGTGTAGAAGGVRIATFYRILEDAADTATTVADSGDHTTAIKMLFRDTALANGNIFVAATSVQTPAATAMTFPAVTSATDESLIVLSVALDTDAASTATVGAVTNANLTSITERHDQTVIAGAGGGLAIITAQDAVAGSTGTSTATGSTSVTRAYTTIALSRIAAQTTTSAFNTITGTSYFPISDAMRITAGSTGTVNATSSGTFQPQTLTNGTYGVNFKWYWRQLGTDTWTTSTAVAQTTSALVSTGVLDTVGEFTDNETVTGLTNGIEYEFVLFAARGSATPANIIQFSATASIAKQYTALAADTGAYTYTGSDVGLYHYKYTEQNTNVYFAEPATTTFAAFSDPPYIFRVRTNNTAQLNFTGDYWQLGAGATDGQYGVEAQWQYQTIGGSWTDIGSPIVNQQPTIISGGVETQTGQIDVATTLTTGLSANTSYNVRLLWRRTSASTSDFDVYMIQDTDPPLTGGAKVSAVLAGVFTITAAAGSFTYSGNNANTIYNRRMVAETGAYSYSGNNANTLFNRRVVAETGTYSYSGNNANTLFNRDVIADTGAFTYAGNNATLTYTTALNNYTITADTGSFTYSGNNANVLFNRNIAAETGAYTYSGNAANVLFNRRVIAEAGSYSYSGNAANVLYNRRIAADPASFSYSGNNAGLLFNRKVIADAGSFAYSGNNAGLLYSRILTADTGAYTYSGNNATLSYVTAVSYTLTADTGSFSYSGNDATLRVAFRIAADTGTYTYSGNAANLLTTRRVVADTGSFSYAGNNANLLIGKKVIAEAGAFTYSGNAANLVASRKVIAEAGTFTYSGNAANLLSGRKVVADTGSYSYSGNAASVLYNRKVVADTGSYSYSGNAASILYNRKLIAAVGSFTYSGNAANISFTGAVSKIYFGTLNISNLKYGSFNIYEAYLGSTQVWGKARPVNTMIAETVAYTYTGNNATLRVGKTLAANGASYSLSGNNSLLKYGRKLVADAASYTYSGNNAVLSKFYTMTRYATVFDDSGNGSSSITAVFNTNGTISFTTSLGDGTSLDTDFTHWHDGGTVSGIGNSRWAKRTLLSGDAVSGSLDTTLVALSASKTIAIQTVAGEGKSGEVLIEIYSDSGGTTKVGQITLTITATL